MKEFAIKPDGLNTEFFKAKDWDGAVEYIIDRFELQEVEE